PPPTTAPAPGSCGAPPRWRSPAPGSSPPSGRPAPRPPSPPPRQPPAPPPHRHPPPDCPPAPAAPPRAPPHAQRTPPARPVPGARAARPCSAAAAADRRPCLIVDDTHPQGLADPGLPTVQPPPSPAGPPVGEHSPSTAGGWPVVCTPSRTIRLSDPDPGGPGGCRPATRCDGGAVARRAGWAGGVPAAAGGGGGGRGRGGGV